MNAPDNSEARTQLARFVGSWTGKETMSPSQWVPEGFVADSETCSREALGGFGVVTDYRQSKDGQTTYEGHGVYTWDAPAGEIVLHWFDNMGTGRDEFRGKWDGDELQMLSRNSMGVHRITYRFGDSGPLSAKMEMGPDIESLATVMEAQYTSAD